MNPDSMLELLCAKFPTPELGRALLATVNDDLIEWNTSHDNGCCSGERCAARMNQNWLGRLLVQVRDEPVERKGCAAHGQAVDASQ